jgi:GST-like protein
MLKFYFNGSPNPTKVALFLEEAGIAYEPMPVDTRKASNSAPPTWRSIPTARCRRSSTAKRWCSTATRSCYPPKDRPFRRRADFAGRGPLLSWLMFVGAASVRTPGRRHLAVRPEPNPRANRYDFEAERH